MEIIHRSEIPIVKSFSGRSLADSLDQGHKNTPFLERRVSREAFIQGGVVASGLVALFLLTPRSVIAQTEPGLQSPAEPATATAPDPAPSSVTVSTDAAESEPKVIPNVDAFAEAINDPNWHTVFSASGINSSNKGFTPIVLPMADTTGKDFRIMAQVVAKGSPNKIHDVLFCGNGQSPRLATFSRGIVSYENESWVFRQQVGGDDKPAQELARFKSIQALGEAADTLVEAFDIRLDPAGINGSFARVGTPDDQRPSFKAAASLLANGRIASAAVSENETATTVAEYRLQIR